MDDFVAKVGLFVLLAFVCVFVLVATYSLVG
jgi:hypothetical protein